MTNKGCRGKECCGPGSTWDDDLKACKTTWREFFYKLVV
jgi:hypothetical protein